MEEFLKNFKKVSIIAIIAYIIFLVFTVPALAVTIAYGNTAISKDAVSFLPVFENLKYTMSNPGFSFSVLFSGSGKTVANFFNLFIIYTSLYWLIICYLVLRMGNKKEWEGIEHGSASWAKNGEEYSVLSKTKGILLAKDHYLPVTKTGNINVMVVGGSGSGKSSSFLIPNVTELLGSYVFTDPKAEIYNQTADYFRDNGYEIKVLNLVNPENSDGFNPIVNIKDETDLDIVTNTIIRGQDGAGPTGGDQYWDNMAELLLKAIILFLKAATPKEERNLASCANLVRMANNNGSFNEFDLLMSYLPQGHKARKYYDSVKLSADKAYSSVLSTLQSKLGKFESKQIAGLTATNTINFTDISEKKTAVFVISSDTHATYDFLLTIFFSQMLQQLYNHADKNGGKLKIPVYFFLDEFANIGQIPDFDKKISTSRSRKISFSVILQNLDQLENLYKDSFETIMANCDTHLFLGSNSQKTAEYFSKQLRRNYYMG